MTTVANTKADTQNLSISVSRIFDAPIDLVFEVMNDCQHMKHWYVCDTMELSHCAIDFRVGGQYRFEVKVGDEVHPMTGTYTLIDRPNRIEHTQIYDVAPYNENVANVVVILHETNNKTAVNATITFPNEASFQGAAATGMEEGMATCYDRLADFVQQKLVTISTPGSSIRAERTFAAPVEKVWETWSKSEHLENWWGPFGFTTTTQEFDFRPGGHWKHTMHAPDGTDFPDVVKYTEIVEHQKLAYDLSAIDDNAPDSIIKTVVTMEPTEGGTKVILNMTCSTAAFRDELEEKYGAVEGARQTLTRLADLLHSL